MLRKIYARYGKSKQFYRQLSSYAIVMLLAIMVNLIGYGTTMRVLEKEAKKNNVNAVANIQVTCDAFYNELLSAAYGLLRSSSV